MSMPLEEHDYIGLSEVPSMENSEKVIVPSEGKEKNKALNLKATELRLGLPGSESRERQDGHGLEDNTVYPSGFLKNFMSGAKRGFSEAIDGGSGKWVFSRTGGSEADLAKNGGLFSSRGVNGGVKALGINGSDSNTQQSVGDSNAVKEIVPPSPKPVSDKKPHVSAPNVHDVAPAAKAQVVGWPPIKSSRRNSMATNPSKSEETVDVKLGAGCLYVKVSMDVAPYLRKVDLKTCDSYTELSSALEKMFSCFTIGQCSSEGVPTQDGLSESRLVDLLHCAEYVLTYEDKDDDWMLVGDVPWEMFINSCKRLRIMKSSDAIGLAPRTIEKCKNQN